MMRTTTTSTTPATQFGQPVNTECHNYADGHDVEDADAYSDDDEDVDDDGTATRDDRPWQYWRCECG